jgi:hypothetical protein
MAKTLPRDYVSLGEYLKDHPQLRRVCAGVPDEVRDDAVCYNGVVMFRKIGAFTTVDGTYPVDWDDNGFTVHGPIVNRYEYVPSYNVQVLETNAPWGPARHMTVERVDGRDGIPWDVLQQLKDEYLGPDACAVEFYPPAGQVVNEINRRHLWEVPADWPPLTNRR